MLTSAEVVEVGTGDKGMKIDLLTRLSSRLIGDELSACDARY